MALVLTTWIPATRVQPETGPHSSSVPSFDVLGAALLIVWLVALLLGLALSTAAADLRVPLALLAVFAVALAAFLRHESRHPEPIIRPSLFRDAPFTLMNLQSIAANYAAFSILLLAPYFLVRARGLDAVTGGLVLALAAIGSVAGSSIAGRLASRYAVANIACSGLAMSVGGLLGIALLARHPSLIGVATALVVQGIGIGLFYVAYADLVTGRLPLKDRGVAGSLTNLTRTIGVVAGATAHAAIQRFGEAAARQAGASEAEAFLAGFEAAFLGAALAAAVAFGLAVLQVRVGRWPSPSLIGPTAVDTGTDDRRSNP